MTLPIDTTRSVLSANPFHVSANLSQWGLEQHIVRTPCSEETFFGLAAIFRYLFKGHATVPRRDNTLRLKTSMAFRVPILDGARDVIVGLTTMAGGVRGRLGMLSKPMPGQGECL